MGRSFLYFIQIFFLLLDLFVLNVVFFLSQFVLGIHLSAIDEIGSTQQLLALVTFWIVTACFGGVYAERHISHFDDFIRKTLQFYLIWALLICVYSVLPRKVVISKTVIFTTVGLFFAGLSVNRLIYFFIRAWVSRRIFTKRKVLILGYNALSRQLTQYLIREEFGVQIVGYVDDKVPQREVSPYPVFTNISNALTLSKELRVNEVYTTIMPENNSKVYQLMQDADRELIRFKIVPDFSYLVNRPVHVDYLRDMPVLTVRREPLEDVINRFLKRAFDIAVSSFVILFIMSWLVPILGLLIYLESPGPIFFSQLRSGKNNQPFKCLKFRSMRPNQDANSKQATKGDKRVTRIGRILRKTSLDEFPQFLNVFVGDMSIVGPRPHMLKHTEEYSSLADDYMIRQYLKPGITGWAQVNGYRGEITELRHIQMRVQYDLWYLENWSLWLDLKIMFLTVYNVFKGEENAY